MTNRNEDFTRTAKLHTALINEAHLQQLLGFSERLGAVPWLVPSVFYGPVHRSEPYLRSLRSSLRIGFVKH
jgi:hypothetical protein